MTQCRSSVSLLLGCIRTIAINDPRRMTVTRLRYANTAEWIKVLLGADAWGPRGRQSRLPHGFRCGRRLITLPLVLVSAETGQSLIFHRTDGGGPSQALSSNAYAGPWTHCERQHRLVCLLPTRCTRIQPGGEFLVPATRSSSRCELCRSRQSGTCPTKRTTAHSALLASMPSKRAKRTTT